ncbi:MAG: nucleoside-triphosphatase [Candidatus Hodarchaeales archaeon]
MLILSWDVIFMVLFALTGHKQTGKTLLAQKLVKMLREDGFSCGGVLCPGLDYRVYINLITGITHQFYLPRDEYLSDDELDYPEIPEKTIAFGVQALIGAAKEKVDVLFVDEVGWLEREKAGFYDPLKDILPERKKPVVIIVRNEVIPEFEELFGVPLNHIWGLDVTVDFEKMSMEIFTEIKKILKQ